MASSPSSSAPAPPVVARPPWVILSRAARVQLDAVEASSLSLELADPPYISQLTLPTSAHPKPTPDGADDDKCLYLYVIAANDAGVLLHESRDPCFNLGTNPSGTFVVARDFLPAADGRGARIGAAMRVPRRGKLQHRVSAVRNFGLLPVPDTDEYVVAELVVGGRSLITFRSDSDFWWNEQILTFPLVWGQWTTHDVVAHDGKLWWADLTQGLLGCNVFDHTPELRYVELPEMFAAKGKKKPGDQIKWYRIVGVSSGRLRFVDVSRKRKEPPNPKKTVVVVWTLVCDPFAKDDDSGKPRWELHTTTTLGTIWASNSYKESRMPEEVPALAFVHPHKPDVVYFFLTEYIFAVDVRNSEVVEFVCGLRQPLVDYWRNCLPWVLPPSRPNALGDKNQSSEELDSHDKKDVALIS